ncbi:putative FeS-containing Cyanobacterial-specific oxidoreductase [Clostridiales bacterium oral taxon 876 str. F0540]|nr:putative FeS-containing Cyanobacterial-specific oxidoreductase [Clostridiales bacterium oral taxon 876 str. F0540]
MKNTIVKVKPNSIAEELEIEIGDKLISINDTEVKDIIDYKFLMADEYVEIEVEKKNGELWCLEVEKNYEEDLGVEFENSILDNARSCSNKCVFCFIDQLPKGMRKTLYFKDDDSRLSFLQGNFVTLTNMKDEDIDRIIRYRISPINVSVHTTNPELRVKMLNNRFAGNVYERLQKLSEANIDINCQIVLCPGINNGDELERTTEDLFKLYPSVRNLAVVPVGTTKFRDGLFNITLYNKETSIQEIKNVCKLQDKYLNLIGQPFIRLSDEFYVTAGMEVPSTEFYGEFEQLEDGIGMIRLLRDTLEKTLPNLDKNIKNSFTMITGASAYKEINAVASIISKANPNININTAKIINNYFGETITVAGLLTGKDIIEQLKNYEVGNFIIMPRNMLRSGEKTLLDDIIIKDIEDAFGRKVLVVDYSGEDLIDIINKFGREEK